MKMQVVLAMMAASLASTGAQFFLSAPTLSFNVQPPPLQALHQHVPLSDPAKRALAHRAVVLNSEAEARLPPSLQNPFYKNPRIEAALAKESWFTPGEQQVREREAEKIPRAKIFSILKNAGLARRR